MVILMEGLKMESKMKRGQKIFLSMYSLCNQWSVDLKYSTCQSEDPKNCACIFLEFVGEDHIKIINKNNRLQVVHKSLL